MNGANHAMTGFSTYPFNIFSADWAEGFDPRDWADGQRGDTIVGHDVWIGRQAVILPGVRIGNGAIVAAHSVVGSDVPDYAIVAGNPAKIVRKRFDDEVVERLAAIAWWNWPIEAITRNIDLIRGGDLARLEAAAAGLR